MQISLRLKLTDFLEHESILIPMIGEISKGVQPFPIYFWYQDTLSATGDSFRYLWGDIKLQQKQTFDLKSIHGKSV